MLILNNFFFLQKKKIKDRKPVKYLFICLLIQYLVRVVQNKKLHASKLKCYYFLWLKIIYYLTLYESLN